MISIDCKPHHFNWALNWNISLFKPFQEFPNYFMNKNFLRAVIEGIDWSNN